MKLLFASRKTLSLVTLFAAGTLSALSAGDTREQIAVGNEAELRAALSEKYQPDGTTGEKNKVYHNNADITLTGSFSVVTTKEVETKDADGNVTGTETYATYAVEVLATGSKILGGGNTLSSSEVALDVKGSGDLFFLTGVSLSVENITFAGTTDETQKTGRVFTTGNATATFSTLSIGANTRFENRRLVADEYTNYRAQGGAIISAHIMDSVSLKSSTSGDIVFSGNVAFGKTLTYTSKGEEKTENLSSAGGAVFTSGLFAVSGAGATSFEKNSAISENSMASGGAMFVGNAVLGVDGSFTTTIYPDAFDGEKDFGVQVSETTLNFSENTATGASAQGGAVGIAGGWFDVKKSLVTFLKNSAKSTAQSATVGGGAMLVSDGGRVTFDANSTVDFSENSVSGTQMLSNASGGAIALSDSTLSLAGTTTFEKNSATADLGGSSAFGGAVFLSGGLEDSTDTDGKTTKVHTVNVNLSGTISFTENTAKTLALSAEKTTGSGESATKEMIESSAQGGAILISGAKVDGSGLTALTFSQNTAESKTTAQGGAFASVSEVSEVVLKTTGAFSFEGNKALVSALASSETQTAEISPLAQGGAVFVSAGTTEFVASAGTLTFTSNSAAISGQADATARGGAIAQTAGTLKLGAAKFSLNSADSAAGTAQGGATYFAGGTDVSGVATFSENTASALIAQGGAVYSAGGTQTFKSATDFTKNTASAGTATASVGSAFARGGAIFAAQHGALNFAGTTAFAENSATATTLSGADTNGKRSGAAGGAVFSAGTLSFADATFENNSASVVGDTNGAAFGGAVYVSGGKLSAQSLTMSANTVSASGDAHGGATYVSTSGFLDVAGNFSLSGNATAADVASIAQGGAVYSAGTMRVGGDFSASGNTASGKDVAHGGAVYTAAGSVEISGIGTHVISGNTATASAANGVAFGGAIYASGNFSVQAGTLTLSGNKAEATTGTALGGAIYLRGGNVTLANATVSGNTASGATAFGGGIYVDVSSATRSVLTFSGNTTIAGNESTTGGENDGIYVGLGTGTEAKGSVSVVFDADADVVTDDAGNSSLQNIETATISDRITVAAGTFSLEKTGNGNLTLGNIEIKNADTNASFNFNGGETTLGGSIATSDGAVLKLFSVGHGAKATLTGTLGQFETANIAGTLNVENGSHFTFAQTTNLTGTLALNGAATTVSGTTAISGAGSFAVSGASTLNFSGADAALTTGTLSLGASSLAVNNAGTLTVTNKIIFTETGDAEITLGAGTTLALVSAARTATDVNVAINGTGTLLLYADASAETPATHLDFSSFYEKVKDAEGKETSELRAGSFTIANTVSIKAGVSVGEGVTLSLAPDSQVSGSKNILLTGGTLLASGSSETSPLGIETFNIATSELVSVLGKAGENQVFKMLEVQALNEDGTPATDTNGNPVMTTHAMLLAGNVEVTETTKFVGNVSFSGTKGALSGAGTVVGDVSGTGNVSIAAVTGNLNVPNGTGMTVSGTVSVGGAVNVYSDRPTGATSKNADFTFASGAKLTATKFNNFGEVRTTSGTSAEPSNAVFSGAFVNSGALIVGENSTLEFAAGSTFTNGFSDGTETLAGTIDLSATNSALDFSNLDETKITLDNGVVRINAATLEAKSALPILGIEDESLFENLKLVDVNDYDLSNRFEWDTTSNSLIFLGLNGEVFKGTLYGDLQREGINRMHDFMRSAMLRATTRQLTPELYGEYKLQSPYMRGYLEKMRQRGGEVSAKAEARHKEELALAEKLNSPLQNLWVQADYSFRDLKARKGYEAYDVTNSGVLLGTSVPVGNWELGLAASFGNEDYKMTSATSHDVETEAYGLAGYGIYKNGWFDWSLGIAGMFASSESERGAYSGEFDSWRLGGMTEVGATLKAQSWLSFRIFGGLSVGYSSAGAFDESGSGKEGLNVKSGSDYGARTSFGLSSSFMVAETLQFTVRTAWLYDFADDVCELDAYMPGTRTDYVLESRENESSALELGAYLNWAFCDFAEVYGGYTGTIRAGERVNSATLGMNFFF